MAMERGAGESWFASRLRDKLGAVRDQRRLRYRNRAARPQRRAEAHPGLPQREQGRGEQAEGDADEGGHEGEAEQRFLPAEAGERQVEDKGDRKSTRLNSVTNAHLVCRLLLEKKHTQQNFTKHT